MTDRGGHVVTGGSQNILGELLPNLNNNIKGTADPHQDEKKKNPALENAEASKKGNNKKKKFPKKGLVSGGDVVDQNANPAKGSGTDTEKPVQNGTDGKTNKWKQNKKKFNKKDGQGKEEVQGGSAKPNQNGNAAKPPQPHKGQAKTSAASGQSSTETEKPDQMDSIMIGATGDEAIVKAKKWKPNKKKFNKKDGQGKEEIQGGGGETKSAKPNKEVHEKGQKAPPHQAAGPKAPHAQHATKEVSGEVNEATGNNKQQKRPTGKRPNSKATAQGGQGDGQGARAEKGQAQHVTKESSGDSPPARKRRPTGKNPKPQMKSPAKAKQGIS